MNESPEGTPNPLNPNPEAAEPATPPVAEPQTSPQPVPEPVAQPVENKPVAVAKPKKTGLIVAIILFIVAIAAGVAAALIVLNPFAAKADAVPTAIAKLMSGDAPKLVVSDGKIVLTANSSSVPFSSLTVDYRGSFRESLNDNYVRAEITAKLTDGTEFSFKADEIHTPEGNLYLKLSDIVKALNDYKDNHITNCEGGEEGTNCEEVIDCIDEDGEDCADYNMPDLTDSVLEFIGVFEVIDDEWILIPDSSFSSITDMASVDTPTQCLVDAFGKLKEYSNDISKLYDENTFINYSTENLKIAQKSNPLYLLSFDAEKMASFINSMSNSGFMNELLACTGETATSSEVTADDLQEMIDLLPTIYVEINSSYDFTRVYLEVDSLENSMKVTADISLSYPTTITITEPETYVELNEVLSRLLTMFYGEEVEDFSF